MDIKGPNDASSPGLKQLHKSDMCPEKWYRYTCGHLISARDDQDEFEHCDNWVEGLDETDCESYDPDEQHATDEIDAPCQDEDIAPYTGWVRSSGAAAKLVTASPAGEVMSLRACSEASMDGQSELMPGDNMGLGGKLLRQDEGAPDEAAVDEIRPVALAHEEQVPEQHGTDKMLVKNIVEDKNRRQGYDKPLLSQDTSRSNDGVQACDANTTCDATSRTADPVRIVIRCLSHKIPGPRLKRKATIADIVCRHCFRRGYDPSEDKINVMGLEDIDGKKVRFLLESGTLSESTATSPMTILAFRWTGEKLVPREVDVRTRAYLGTLPFKHTPPRPVKSTASRTKSVSEMQESLTPEQWDQYMREFLKRRLQYEKVAGNLVKSWAREHPDGFFDVMQEYVAQKRWHKLILTPAEERWAYAQKHKDQPASFASQMEMVLEEMGKARPTTEELAVVNGSGASCVGNPSPGE